MTTKPAPDVAQPDASLRPEKENISFNDDGNEEPGVISKSDKPVDSESADVESIDYHSLEWWQAGVVLFAETVSLGILSLPAVIATVGLVPGIVLIVVMGILSTYSGLVMGEFHAQYPHTESFGDALEVVGNSIGCGVLFQQLFGSAQTIFQIFVMGSHLLTFTICLNTLTNSSTCTIVWAVVGLVVFWLLNIPRTLKFASYYSWASFLSVVTAVMVTMIDVGIEKPIGTTAFDITRQVPFTSAFLAVTNIAVAFSGHSCFFGVMAEFREPRDWPKALWMLQICDTTLYIVASVVIYIYTGPDVPSPALSAAHSPKVRKAIWGIAIPTIVLAGVIYGHVAAKYIFVRIFKNTRHHTKRTKTGTMAWLGITAVVWCIAFVIAESIPVFSNLLGLVAALFASWFSFGIPGGLWLWMNHGNYFTTTKGTMKFVANVVLMVVALMICSLGLWSSGEAIASDDGNGSWSCESNAAP